MNARGTKLDHDLVVANDQVVEPSWDQTRSMQSSYAGAVHRAAVVTLAMGFSPNLKFRLIKEITAAVKWRGGQIDGHWLVKYELRAVCEEVVERALAMLSIVLRHRLPGVADEMDEAFGDQLRDLLSSLSPLFPTL